MKKEDIQHLPEFYRGYVATVSINDLIPALIFGLEELEEISLEKWTAKNGFAYFPGKWTLNEVIQHMIDTERVMAYRATAFARNDENILPAFDEDAYAAYSDADQRSIADLLEELRLVRRTSILMFKGFSETAMKRSGIANQSRIDVLALGFVIAGHLHHHKKVIEERYL